MKNYNFEKLCEETFFDLIDSFRGTISDFPQDISLSKEIVLDDENLLNLMNHPLPLKVSEAKELYYENGDGEKVFIDPRIEDDVILKGYVEDVFSMLPSVPFDLHCGGIKRKQQEVAAAYIVCVVNAFLKNVYIDEIKNVTKDYNFESNRSNAVNGTTFTDVLKIVQEDATPIVKFIINCCYTVLSESTEKNDALYIGIVSQKDQEVLDQIISEIKTLEYKCNKTVEKQSKKLDRLKTIDTKDKEKQRILNSYGPMYKVLYNIHMLNSTNLDPMDAPTIKQICRKKAKTLLEKDVLVDQDFLKKFVYRQSQKALRMRVRKLKIDKFNEFSLVQDGNYDNILPKN